MVSPETLSHGAEINESTTGLSALAQSEVGAPYQSKYPDIRQAGRKTAGAAESRVYPWEKNKVQKTLHYALQNTGSMSCFIELVAYKAKRLGKRVIPINEAYTTQICAQCGHHRNRSLSERTMVCGNCGLQLDRDLNAAVNILAGFYLQKEQWADLLQEPSVNEESFFRQWKGFLRQTANGKTRVSLSSYWARFSGLVGSPVW